MTRPPNLANVMLALVVWLTLSMIAASVLLLPLYRLLVPNWPEALVEWVDAAGKVELRTGTVPRNDDAVPRSRPLYAATIEFLQQANRHGYVIGLRRDGRAQALPDGRWWSPAQHCELGLADSARAEQVLWIDCAAIKRVVWPNRLTLIDRMMLAGRRVIEARFEAGESLVPQAQAAASIRFDVQQLIVTDGQHHQAVETQGNAGALG